MTQMVHEPQPAPWSPDDSTLGARLALLRQAMRWNIAEAARECGINPDSWRLWEEGRKPRDLTDIAKAISKRTGCDVNWLVLGPSRAHLEHRAADTLWEQPQRQNPGIPSQRTVTTHRPAEGLPTTRAVTATRPLRQQRLAGSLQALALGTI